MIRKIKKLTPILILMLTAINVQAETYLYLMFHDDNSDGERFRTEMPNMKTCMDAVTNAKMPFPKSASGDYEVMAAMWCGTGKFSRHYGHTWWRDKEKDTK